MYKYIYIYIGGKTLSIKSLTFKTHVFLLVCFLLLRSFATDDQVVPSWSRYKKFTINTHHFERMKQESSIGY